MKQNSKLSIADVNKFVNKHPITNPIINILNIGKVNEVIGGGKVFEYITEFKIM